MKGLEFKHTLGVVEKLKKDLKKILFVLSIISFVAFLGFYIYQSIINVHNIAKLIINIIFATILVSTMTVEIVFRNNKIYLSKIDRQKLEQKEKHVKVLKIVKLITSGVASVIAIYDFMNNHGFSMENVSRITVVVIFVVQILTEIIGNFILRYIKYFKLAVDLDAENNLLLKRFMKEQLKTKKEELKYLKEHEESPYTVQEERDISMLREEAEEYKKQTEQLHYEIREYYKKKIKEEKLEGKLLKHTEKINAKLEKFKEEARGLLGSVDKVLDKLDKAEQMIGKISGKFAEFEFVPEFISLVRDFIAGNYTDIDKEKVILILATILYLISPIDILPDFLVDGHLDDKHVVSECFKTVELDLEKFYKWVRKLI